MGPSRRYISRPRRRTVRDDGRASRQETHDPAEGGALSRLKSHDSEPARHIETGWFGRSEEDLLLLLRHTDANLTVFAGALRLTPFRHKLH